MKAGTRTVITLSSRHAAFNAANIAESKKGTETLVLDVQQVTLLADYFVIVGGESAAQIQAIVEAINVGLSALGYPAHSVEGKKDGRWVVIDFGDVIVHVLQERERSYYRLEQFWNHALIVDKKEWRSISIKQHGKPGKAGKAGKAGGICSL